MALRDRGLVIVTLIVSVAFVLYRIKEFSTPLLYGIDGPYYYVQVRYILERGPPVS